MQKLPVLINLMLDCNAAVQLVSALRKLTTDEEQESLGAAMKELCDLVEAVHVFQIPGHSVDV